MTITLDLSDRELSRLRYYALLSGIKLEDAVKSCVRNELDTVVSR